MYPCKGICEDVSETEHGTMYDIRRRERKEWEIFEFRRNEEVSKMQGERRVKLQQAFLARLE